VILDFADRDTAACHEGRFVRRFQGFVKIARRKLDMLDAAQSLQDLKSPPGNQLEALSGNRAGQHSIRINDQWRICFVWTEGVTKVEIVDYH
jgi:toxin HigB-1